MDGTDEQVAPEASGSQTPHFKPALLWSVAALASPWIASALGYFVDYGGEGGVYTLGFKIVAGVMGLICATAFYFSWRTQKEAAEVPWKRRLTYLTGALSALVLLFWFLGTLALSRLGPSWR